MLRKTIFFLFFSIAFTNLLLAQTKDENAVNAAVTLLRKAMIDGDQKMLALLTADKLSYGHSGGNVEDRQTFISSLTSGKSDFVSIDLTEQTVTVSGNTAIVRHKLNAVTNDNGKAGTVSLAVMTVWQKQHKNWVLLARQAVKLAPAK